MKFNSPKSRLGERCCIPGLDINLVRDQHKIIRFPVSIHTSPFVQTLV